LVDLRRLAKATSKVKFEKIPEKDRFSFTWEEAKKTQRYKAVLAWPLRGGPQGATRFVGCLSVDAQTDNAFEQLEKLTAEGSDVREQFTGHAVLCEAIFQRY
jgi:hypothetical protein